MNEQVLQVITEFGLKIGGLVLAVLFALLWRELKKYVVLKIGSEDYGHLKNLAESVVRALEQEGIIRKLDGAAKKQMAMNTLRALCERSKLVVSDDVLSMVIEEFVQIINAEAGKFDQALPFPEITPPAQFRTIPFNSPGA